MDGDLTAEERLRDLTSRLGFGDGVSEPQADNDAIVRWFEERSSEADEWVESQFWRHDCYAAGHPDTEDCYEHDPALRLLVAERKVAAVRAVLDKPDDTQWWPVVPYMDPHDEDEVVEVQVINADRILAALTDPDGGGA